MRKKYLKLTKEQKARGVIFSSALIGGDSITVHEVTGDQKDSQAVIDRLLNDKFFNSYPFLKYNLIRK